MMTDYDLRSRPGRWRAGAIYVREEETEEIVYEGPGILSCSPPSSEGIRLRRRGGSRERDGHDGEGQPCAAAPFTRFE